MSLNELYEHSHRCPVCKGWSSCWNIACSDPTWREHSDCAGVECVSAIEDHRAVFAAVDAPPAEDE